MSNAAPDLAPRRTLSLDWLSLILALSLVALVRAGLLGSVPW